jgi:hypothetical protein
MSSYRTHRAFIPSQYSVPSYGEAEIPEGYMLVPEPEPKEKKPLPLEEIISGTKAFLGIDDPRKQVSRLENRLRDLKYGNPAEKTAAMFASGALTIDGAIEKTENKLAEAEAAAFQTKTRDMLYTAMALTAVAAGGALTIWLGTKAYAEFRGSRRG